MGQSQSDTLPEGSLSQSTQIHLYRRFIVSPHPVYVNNPEFKLLHEKLTNKQYILRIVTLSDDFQRAKLEESIFKKIASKNEYLPKLEHYIFQEYKGYCGKVVKCYLFFQIGEFTTFRQQILKQANHRAPFTEDELLKGIDNLIYGLLWLRFFKEPHGNINTLNIYYRNGALLLTDPLIAPSSNENPQRYISPQKMQKIQNTIQDYDPYISDVFSIAMCILQALKYGHTEKVYKKNGKLNSGLLIEEVNRLKFERLKELLQRLLVSANNTQHRQIFLQNFWKKYSQSMVSSHISSDHTQKIHTIGGGRRNLIKNNQAENNFMTAEDINLQFKKNKSVVKPQRRQATVKNLDSSQLIYRVNPDLPRPTQSYIQSSNYQLNPPFRTSYNQSIKYNQSISIPNYNQDTNTISYNNPCIAFNNNYKPFSSTTSTNYQQLPIRNHSIEKIIPSLDSLTTPLKYQPPKSYIPFSQNANSDREQYKSIIQKLQYPLQSKPTFISNLSTPPQAYSLFNQRKELNSSNYKSRFIVDVVTPQRTDEIVKEHSFPKRISSLKKYSENHIYKKYLQGHESIKKTISKKQSNNSESELNESKRSNEEIFKGSDVPNKKTVSNIKQQPANGNIQLYSSQKDLNNVQSISNKQISPLKSSSSKKIEFNSDRERERNLQSIENKQQSKSQRKIQTETQQQKEVKEAKTPILDKRQEKQQHPSSSTSKQFEQILDKNLINLEQVISNAFEKTIKSLEKQPVTEFQNPTKETAPNSKRQVQNSNIPTQLSSKLQDLPLMISDVVADLRDQSEAISETVEQPSRQLVSQSYEINIPDAKDEHLHVKNSMNIEQQLNKSDKEPRSPKTPARPYNPHTRNRYNRTIPEEDPAEEESVEEGFSPPKHQRGEYREEEYQNGGRYCGFVLNNQRNGEGTFYYKDGGYYEGQWKDNAMNGYGKLFYDNGTLAYQGQWYRDQFHGRGKVYNDSATDLIGQFNYRSFEDYYEQYWKMYDGDLSHDVKEGHGKLVFSNNQFYIGKFSNDLPDGEGYFHAKNKIIHGVWDQGKLVKQL